jgi:Ni,Fe-hydrogenase III large subunit/Ni,Fe-hydrogenase III component G
MQATTGLLSTVERLPGAAAAYRIRIEPDQLRAACDEARADGARLVALWGSDETPRGAGFALHVALGMPDGLVWITVPLAAEHARYPTISDLFPAANRMQRAAYDLLGIHADESSDHRKWLRHGAWPGGTFPLRKGFDPASRFPRAEDRYPFVKVEGEGVHEIPVGPVHAGTIEPGHFRFSIVGEKILRLEERLGYTHKGIEKRFEAMSLAEGARLAGRISGDSTVAFAWAYAMAVEGAGRVEAPSRAAALRGCLLELERITNHLGDLGYLGNDVSLSFGFFQFWRLKEDLLRLNDAVFAHRYLMDVIVPGGVARDISNDDAGHIVATLDRIESEVRQLRSIYDEHAGVQDRFLTTGEILPELAARMGLTGFAARASGIRCDLRIDHPVAPYDTTPVRIAIQEAGDVAARVAVRFDEFFESTRMLRMLLEQLPDGPVLTNVAPPAPGRSGIGWVEGWRGEVLVALDTGGEGRIHRLHAHDPSWQNWPLLERAVLGNIVPDFPLINKSFNLSYSGQDL